MKIKTRLVLSFGLMVVVILVIASGYGLYKVRSLSIESNEDLIATRVELKVKALDEKLLSYFEVLQMAAKEIDVSEDGAVDQERIEKSLINITDQLHAIEAYFAVEDGTTYVSSIPGGPIPDFNAKKKQREWYLKVFRDNAKWFISKPYLSVSTDKFVISIGVPIVRNKNIVGSLCIDVEMGAITSFVTDLSNNKKFFVTNEDGVIFGSENIKEVGTNLFVILPVFKEYNDKEKAQFDFVWEQKGNIEYRASVISIKNLNWRLWQYESFETINKYSNDFICNIIVFIAIFIVLVVVITYLIAGRIARPIICTAEALASFVNTGDTFVDREDSSLSGRRDEIGAMARAFNDMIKILHEKAMTAKEIADGNLQVDVKVLSDKDHLGLAFSQMVNDLNSILGQVDNSVNQVTDGAAQISSSSNSLSDGATQQAASIEEISASITQLGTQTKANAENAAAANTLASETATAAKSGQERMNKLTEAMNQISVNAEETQKVIKTIDDIAFQTNLLALNAAVEAARAGTHGKGFAVVAEEVRNLAARSAKAAAETAELIQNSNSQINDGVSISQQTAEALDQISGNVVKTTETVQEIASASHEQAEGISQIGIGLEQINVVTQQNTASAEETASASEEMSGQANVLQKLVRKFKLKNNTGIRSNANRRAGSTEVTTARKPQAHKNVRGVIETEQAEIVKPSEQILLDDTDFGKF